MRPIRPSLLVGMMLAACACQARADTQLTSNLGVSVTIPGMSSCTISSTTAIDFGSYSTFGTSPVSNIAGAITVSCNAFIAYKIGLGKGLGAGATTSARFMTRQNGTEKISYVICQPGSATTLWGDIDDTNPAPYVPLASLLATYAISAKLTWPNSNPPAGYYADTVQITLSF